MPRLLEHLPAFYRDIKEFRELSKTVSEEYDAIDSAFEQVENDQFIITSSEPAIYRREKDFGIVPDIHVETLSFRKRRLITRMQDNPPYVDEYLKELLDSLLGANMTQLEMDKLRLEMEVLVHVESASFYSEVQRILERIVPLNVDITTAVLLIKGYLILKSRAYGFDVIYKACGEFGGEKESGQRGVGAINVIDDSYGYGVEYPVAEKQSELVALDDMQLINDTYDYPKFYGVAGEMETPDKFVSTNEKKTEVNGDIYNFAINYPVCGEFHAEGE